MSTLPRTRSLSGADTVSLSSKYRERYRPASLCENSWHRIISPAQCSAQIARQTHLKRTPSQANSISTTVPTSLVPRNLGKRHVPTKTSLKHSRMFNVHHRSKVFMVKRQQALNSLGRVGVLVLAAQMFVGSADVLLASWLLLWTPNLNFRVVPHYAGVPVLSSGLFGSFLFCCLSGKKAFGISVLKAIVICFSCISILTCSCVCVFTSLHLIRLAPMDCSTSSTVYPLQVPKHFTHTTDRSSYPIPRINVEGSGDENLFHSTSDLYEDEEDNISYVERLYPEISVDERPLRPEHPQTVTHLVNKSICVCEQLRKGWRIVDRYDLSCVEVRNILPIFLVASIIVNSVGCVLCGVILYMLYNVGRLPRHRPSEARPFIYKSQFKKPGQTGGRETATVQFDR